MRKVFDFHGGIHPQENKRQSVRAAIANAGIPPELVLPLSQHIGATAVPVVSVGESVLKGQLIAAASGFVSVPLHAPTSGLITAIEDRPIAHPSGHLARCIVIASDGRDEWIDHHGTPDYHKLDQTELLERIRAAGIAGLGGAGFPTAVKLSVKPEKRISTLIINGTECEPYITADDMLMRERAVQVIEGTKILRQLLDPTETLIGVEDNKPEAIAALRLAAEDSGIVVIEFPTKYPSGGEKQLIQILTGKEVPSGGLPLDVGVICQNIGSAAAVYDAIMLGRPLISRVTTVTGEAVREQRNFEVLLGTPIRFLLARAGYQPANNQRLIMGGPMMGFTVLDDSAPIVKTTNCLLAPTATELSLPAPAQACIRCGLCAEACPVSLLPQQLFWFAQGKEFEKLESHQLFDCIECGACSWVCPSNIPLVQYYRASKAEIIHLRQENEMAERSRIRFEARQQRLAEEEAEKVARRSARKKAAEQRAQEAAAGSQTEVDPIQAAIDRARAKKAAQQTASGSGANELEMLEKKLATTRQRLESATTKLEQARADNSDIADALQAAVDKTRDKLEAALQALTDYQQANRTSTSAQSAPADAAEAAIRKARAARAADPALDPREHARVQLEKLQLRLDSTHSKLHEYRERGEPAKVIDALEATSLRLGDKVREAQQHLDTLEQN